LVGVIKHLVDHILTKLFC